MYSTLLVLLEQIKNFRIEWRIARYNNISEYQNHYLGRIWQYLNPLMQISIYFFIFGIAFYANRKINGVPYIYWLIIGLSGWFFMQTGVNQASKSIQKQMGLLEKMKFPMSSLPTISIMQALPQFFVIFTTVLILLVISDTPFTIYWLQIFYYFIAMVLFVFSFSIFNSAMTVVVPDYNNVLVQFMRMMFWLTGVTWDPTTSHIPGKIQEIIQILPFHYIVQGFRSSLLDKQWFWQDKISLSIFWFMTLFLLILGSVVHIRLKDRFVDFS